MKISLCDARRVHLEIGIEGDERTEMIVWGDVRTVSILLEKSDGIADMLSVREGRQFRPERAQLEWQRNTYWGGDHYGWIYVRELTADWRLTSAGIVGTNIRKDGSLGKLNAGALYRDQRAWGLEPKNVAKPAWYLDILAAHDPDLVGSPLDTDPSNRLKNGTPL